MNKTASLKPEKAIVPLAEALRWRGGGGYRYEEKIDGVFQVRTVDDSTVAGELVAHGYGSVAPGFYAFDCLEHGCEDVRRWPLSERLKILDALTITFPRLNILRPATGNGGEFLEAVLARGGEGVVAKELCAPYGQMFAAKQAQTFFCVITGRDEFRASVTLADSVTGEARGQLPLRARFDLCRIGSVLKIEAFGLTARGLLRDARPDKDAPQSWLARF